MRVRMVIARLVHARGGIGHIVRWRDRMHVAISAACRLNSELHQDTRAAVPVVAARVAVAVVVAAAPKRTTKGDQNHPEQRWKGRVSTAVGVHCGHMGGSIFRQ
jgi:hypothetical protein